MVRYKQILAAACVFAALGASNVAAAETTLNENDLVIDKTVTVIGDQVLPDSAELAKVEEARTGSIEVVLTDGKAGTNKSNVMFSCQKVADFGKLLMTMLD